MKSFLILFLLLAAVSCGKNGEDGADGVNGSVYAPLSPVVSSIDLQDIEPGLACAEGGVAIVIFQDSNADGVLQEDETITKTKAICHGSSASLTVESVTSSSTCPNGGVVISSSSTSAVEVCHGVNGLNGTDGADGRDGVSGTTGTSVIPVKFCQSDNSTFSEYGLLIGGELFAVYWDAKTGSAKKEQAFLTKLDKGLYQSTGGNNCLFEVK